MHRWYMFSEAPMARQRKYASIRSENLQMRRQQMEDGGEIESVGRFASVHYFTSQYLSESSLNADVSQFDFSGAVCVAFIDFVAPELSTYFIAILSI